MELVACRNPFSNTALIFPKIPDSQIGQLGRGVIGWKAAAGFGGFPNYTNGPLL
jgi:hypothetical protein